jgi:hypothetical protein
MSCVLPVPAWPETCSVGIQELLVTLDCDDKSDSTLTSIFSSLGNDKADPTLVIR